MFFSLGRQEKLKTEIIIIIFLIFLAIFIFFLRSRNLDRLSLWMDEGFYVLAADKILHHGYPLYPSGHILFKGILYSYLLSLAGWLFGPSVYVFRLISVLASVLVVIVFYFLARKFVNPGISFLGAVLLSFSAWETEYARTAIYFSLLQLIYLACLYLFLQTYLEEKKKDLWPMTILFLLAPHIHQLAMGTLFSFAALFFIVGFRRFFRRDIMIPLILIIASYLLLQFHELFFWKVGYVYEKEPATLNQSLSYFFKGFTLDYFREMLRSFPRMGFLVLAGLFLCLGLKSRYHSAPNHDRDYLNRWFFLNVVFFLPLIFFGIFRTHVQPRYLFQLHPILLLLFLVAIKEFSQAAVNLLLTPFWRGHRPLLFQKILVVAFFLTLTLYLSDQVGWKTTQRIVNRDYKDRISTDLITRSGRLEHYDHQSVGRYVGNYSKPDDIVIAMHMVFQYIYGGKVDYWLWTGGPGTWDAWEKTPEGWKDVYIGAIWLNSLTALQEIIATRGERRLWLVTSPSLYRRDHISEEVANFIQSQEHHLLFRGRDGMSAVYLWDDPTQKTEATLPGWEAEWLPTSLGKIIYDPSASRGCYLQCPAKPKSFGTKTFLWPGPLSPGKYLLRMALRNNPSVSRAGEGQLEITFRTRNSRLVIFSHAIRSKELQPEGKWINLVKEINIPAAEEITFTLTFRGNKSIDWDFLDFQPTGENH